MDNKILQQILETQQTMSKNQELIFSELKALKQGQAKLEQGQVKLEQGQVKLEQGLAKLEQRQANLEQGLAKTNTKLDNLTELVHGIHAHQEMDYALLQAIDKKVTNLANISETHEQKFQKLKML